MLAKRLAACIYNSFRVIRCLSQYVSPQIAILPHFCFRWGRPWGNHAKCCMDEKKIQCLQIVSQHVPIYLQQFPSYTMLKSMRKSKNHYFYLSFSVIRTVSAKNRHFHVAQLTFLFPLETPLEPRLSRNM